MIDHFKDSQLDAVTFQPGYLTMTFFTPENPVLNLTILTEAAVLSTDSGVMSVSDDRFKNALCDCISSIVTKATREPDVQALLTFSNGCSLMIPLDEERKGESGESMWMQTGDEAEYI